MSTRWPRLILPLSLILVACGPAPSPSVAPSTAASPSAPGLPSPSASTVAGLPDVPDGDLYYPKADAVAASKPGELLQTLEINAPTGTRAWFVVYGSTGLDGKPVAVSGLILAPEAPPASGGHLVVAWAHGTTGVADLCAPSKTGLASIPAEISDLVAKGYVVTATDYEGLGTNGVHPYLVGISEGRSVLDSIRAVQTLPDAHAAADSVVVGLSQGGHAALWAAELAPSYAPGLSLLGSLALSPPTSLVALDTWAFHQAAAGSVEAAAPALLLFGVYNAIYDAPLNFLTNAGRQSALAGREGCSPPPVSTTPYLRDPAEIAEWNTLLTRNSPGLALTPVPIRVVSPKADQAVQYDTQVAGVEVMCAIGDTVELRSVEGDHFASFSSPTAWADATAWIHDRFAGVEAVTTCAALPS
jgi:hypothetical protein